MTFLIVLTILYIVTVGLSLYVLNRAIFVSKEVNPARLVYFIMTLSCLMPIGNIAVILIMSDQLEFTFVRSIGNFFMSDIRKDN